MHSSHESTDCIQPCRRYRGRPHDLAISHRQYGAEEKEPKPRLRERTPTKRHRLFDLRLPSPGSYLRVEYLAGGTRKETVLKITVLSDRTVLA